MHSACSYDAQGLCEHPSLKMGIEFSPNGVPEESMRNPIFGQVYAFFCRCESLSDKLGILGVSVSLEIGSA